MPLTFPAHQGLAVGAKLRWPRSVDATALCVGAAAPDLAYVMGPTLNQLSHRMLGLIVWSVPVTLVLVFIIRRWSAPGIFSSIGDVGPLRLRSYAAITRRRPSLASTLVSAFAGSLSHIAIDTFTHRGRWGANTLGLNRVIATVPLRGDTSWAGVLQYSGHLVGSMLFVWLVLLISRRHLLEEWYGVDAIREARQIRPTPRQRLAFWIMVLTPTIGIQAVADRAGASRIFSSITVLVPALLLAGWVIGSRSASAPGPARSSSPSPQGPG